MLDYFVAGIQFSFYKQKIVLFLYFKPIDVVFFYEF